MKKLYAELNLCEEYNLMSTIKEAETKVDKIMSIIRNTAINQDYFKTQKQKLNKEFKIKIEMGTKYSACLPTIYKRRVCEQKVCFFIQ